MKINSRWQTFFHALAFVAGFTLVFVLLGASVAFVGYALNAWMPMIAKIGGVVLILFGLQVVGAFPWLADRLRATGGDKNALGRGFIAFSHDREGLQSRIGPVEFPRPESVRPSPWDAVRWSPVRRRSPRSTRPPVRRDWAVRLAPARARTPAD